ncbi:MAG: ABC transporter ATP-binding protein [Planctomycetota bacterium]|jgi:ABC-2 type transport system ATP-binding protein|nr:MAG: ABC transporter ATP-binding protein [Planctomycetota bacterium]RLS93391.1 MAG: ABC transporter ATP-binding protein [Planctomycetota bacterium]
MIETVNLTKKYGDFVALDNLNLTIDEGTCFGFIGPNGAGKTTTIKILATLLKPTWGEARIDGKVVGYQNSMIRPLIGYVPDFMGAYQDMTVSEYLEFFAACYAVPSSKREKTISEVLTLTDLTHKTQSEVNGLSRGMQQRLAVARVLIHDPKVLLMDEPSSGLDPRARIEMRELLKELRRIGKTILISSHILSELADLCNAVGVIEQGKLVFAGPLSDLMARAKVGRVIQIAVEARAEEAATLLRGVKGVFRVDLVLEEGGKRIDVQLEPNAEIAASELAARLLAQGFRLARLQPEEISLETAFMRLTKGLVS